jgi:hypothetical protein
MTDITTPPENPVRNLKQDFREIHPREPGVHGLAKATTSSFLTFGWPVRRRYSCS